MEKEEERYVSDYEKIRHRDEHGERVVWSTQKKQTLYIEDLGNIHILSAWSYTNKKNPLEPKLTYLAREISFRGLQERLDEVK